MTSRGTLRVGTRGSTLALRQAREVAQALGRAFPGISLDLCVIRTRGDTDRRSTLTALGRGVFVREMEQALLRGDIDLAVHSMKDVPQEVPPGLQVLPVLRRADPREALANRWGLPLERLPSGARLGTGSPRRRAQLLHLRPDLEVVPVRGNVETRLRKAGGGECDAVVLALAGLLRLGRESEACQVFPPEEFVPDAGQGALAVEFRADDGRIRSLVPALQDADTVREVEAERAFARLAGGGCYVPVGACARAEGDRLRLTALIADPEGRSLLKATVEGDAGDPEAVARLAWGELEARGAQALLEARRGG